MNRFCLIMAFASLGGAWADIPLKLSQYQIQTWSPRLAHNDEYIVDMVRAPNDYLWVGSINGLLRFDGHSFVKALDSPLRWKRPWALTVSKNGELFCAVSQVGVVRVSDGKATVVWSRNMRAQRQPYITYGADGHLYVIDGAEVFRENQGKFVAWARLPAVAVSMVELKPGIWAFATENNTITLRTGDGRIQAFRYPPRFIGAPYRLLPNRKGGVLLATTNGILSFHLGPRGLVHDGTIAPGLFVFAMVWGAGEELWIGGNRGLYRFENGQLTSVSEYLHARSTSISALAWDKEGSLWGWVIGEGIFRLTRPRMPNWTVKEGIPGNAVRSALHDGKGGVWLAASEGTVHLRADGTMRPVKSESWRRFSQQRMMFRDPATIWELTNTQLYEINTETYSIAPVPLPPVKGFWILLFQGRDRVPWIGTSEGEFFTRERGKWVAQTIAGLPPTISAREIASAPVVTECPNGTRWMSSGKVGLVQIDGRVARPIAPARPEWPQISCVYCDADNTIWVGFDGLGFGRVHNEQLQLFRPDGPSVPTLVSFVAEDTSGSFWLGVREAVVRVRKSDLIAYFNGHTKECPYNRITTDTLLTAAAFRAALDKTHQNPSRIIWMPESRGAVRIDTAESFEIPPPPRVRIDGAVVDGVSIPTAAGKLEIPPGAQRVEFSFHAPYPSAPTFLGYKYQLVGFQDVPIQARSERNATFTRLPPGDYAFKVWAGTGDGKWSEQAASLAVRVAAAWYQTWSFYAAAGLAGAGLFLLAYRFRVRQLVKKEKHLQATVAERTRELAQAKAEAELANRAKSDFLAVVSHEMRTPLNGVIGLTTILLDSTVNKQQAENLNLLKCSGEALLTVINDILDFSKIEAGKIELESISFDLRSLMEEAIEMVAVLARQKGLSLNLSIEESCEGIVQGDRNRVRQILLNFLSNALKFTETGGILVQVHRAGEGNRKSQIRIAVQDSGIGLRPEMKSRLFQSFSQADPSSSRKYGGTGLGLSISKRLAELMGGEVDYESEPGRGSTFWFTASLFPVETAVARPAAWQRLAGLRVLLFCADPLAREIAGGHCRAAGMHLTHAGSEEEEVSIGTASAADCPIDLILNAWPARSPAGAAFLRAIRALPAVAHLPVAFVGDGDASGFSAENACWIQQPASREKFLQAIAALIEPAPMATFVANRAGTAVVPRRGLALLAEDNAVNQKVGRMFLERMGFVVHLAPNGSDAVEAIRAGRFELIFMDCQMPVMDGYLAAKKIREMEVNGDRTPIIAITANAGPGEREKCVAAGMDDLLTKPLHVQALTEMVEKWTKREKPLRKSVVA